MNVRPVLDEDLPTIAAFLAADEERLFGRPSRTGIDDVRAWMSEADLERDSWLYRDDAGEIRALGWVELQDATGVAVGVVHADARGCGIGSELVERAELRLRERSASRIHQITLAADSAASQLLAERGYRDVRRFWEMGIDLAGPPPPPVLPEGMRIQRFTESMAGRFHDTLEEAFRDHWEHRPRPFEEWWEGRRKAPDYDPALWFAIRDGVEIAAAVRGDPFRSGGGWIAALGVRRPWRGRGLAKALLLRSFAEFHRRGVNRVSLVVDAENPTGATALYEGLGMRVEFEQVVYEKELA
jgi:mycothiol synthase